jgi:predicted secreted protein
MFSDNAKQAETAQSFLNKTLKRLKLLNQQTASMKTLVAIAQDETASKRRD